MDERASRRALRSRIQVRPFPLLALVLAALDLGRGSFFRAEPAMPRVATATASTGEGNAAAGSSERPTPEAQQQPLPPPGTTTSNADLETSTDAGSNAGGLGGYGELDPLAQQELEAFGAEAEHDTLPRPPRDPNAFAGAAAAAAAAAAANSAAGGGAGGAATPKSTSAGAGPGSGNKRSLAATAEPLARAKRPKSVKIRCVPSSAPLPSDEGSRV